VAKAVGGIAIELGTGSGNRLNPLDEEPHPCRSQRRGLVCHRGEPTSTLLGALAESVLARPMTAVEHTALDLALRDAANRDADPPWPLRQVAGPLVRRDTPQGAPPMARTAVA